MSEFGCDGYWMMWFLYCCFNQLIMYGLSTVVPLSLVCSVSPAPVVMYFIGRLVNAFFTLS